MLETLTPFRQFLRVFKRIFAFVIKVIFPHILDNGVYWIKILLSDENLRTNLDKKSFLFK